MKLKSFKEKDKKKIGILLFTIVCMLFITGVILYKTFAIFETNDKYDVMNGNVEEVGDIYFAFYKDGVIQKNMPTKNEGYVLDEEQSYCGVLGEHNPNIKVSMGDDETIKINGVTTSRTKCNLYFVRGVYILGKGFPLVTEGNGLYEVKHEEIELNENWNKTEYRFAGVNYNEINSSIYVHNYVNVDGQVWRIIGLVNTLEGQRIKLIKEESIGEYSWDTSASNINGGYGINEWSEADIMKLLNPSYDTNKLQNNVGLEQDLFANNSLYWNGNSGQCYNDTQNHSDICDFSINGIPNYLKYLIDNVTWNTGSNDGEIYSYSNIPLNKMYELERGTYTGKYCATLKDKNEIGCTDVVNRTTTWKTVNEKKALVGLMYPSDYGYATIGGENINQESCYDILLNLWGIDTDYSECAKNDWLYQNNAQWTITPFSYSTNAYNAYIITATGKVDAYTSGKGHSVRPVVFLKENVKITSGTGELGSPFTLSFIDGQF